MTDNPSAVARKAAASLRTAALGAAFLSLATAGQGNAQGMRCAGYETTIRALAGRHGEHLYDTKPAGNRPDGSSAGKRHAEQSARAAYELWLNMTTGSFTVLLRRAGTACLIKAGRLDPSGLKAGPDRTEPAI